MPHPMKLFSFALIAAGGILTIPSPRVTSAQSTSAPQAEPPASSQTSEDAQQGRESSLSKMEPRNVAQLRYVTSAAIDPAGKYIAYTVSVPREPLEEEDGPAWSELHITDTSGNSRPFITGEVSITAPQWSDDGRWIYYLAKREGDEQRTLYRIAIDGGESTRVVKHETSIADFDLAPGGKQVAFLANEERAEPIEKLREQGFNQEIYEEDWLPQRVYITSLHTDARQHDLDREARPLELKGSAHDVKWSPNGQDLMVVLAPTPSVDDSYMFKRVHVVHSETGHTIRSLQNPGKLGQIAWSPDGKRLAIVSGRDIHDPHEGRLLIASVDGDGELKDLLPDLEAHVGSIAWKDNQTIYWLAAEGVQSRLGEVTIEGQRTDLMEPVDGTVYTDFSLASQSGSFAVIGHDQTHPWELFAMQQDELSLQRLTDVNPWLAEIRFAKQEAIQWEASDGMQIGGVLIYPLDYVEGRRYPTIMYVHGGPESHESHGWLTSYSRPGQVAAARGFAVFYPNYRGSTGRSVEFSMRGQADAGGKEFQDLIDGIDHLIEKGITDKDAVGVTGGSYGGYASAWCSTYYSDRFAASVMFVGISDNVSKVGTTDIPEEMFLVHHRKRLWDDWEYFLESSPIRYIERNETPTLILHGKQDTRVHPSQSLEFYRHLKTLDQAPVRLVLYEGEGHGNRKAAARLDYNLRMLRWMEHFLQKDETEAPSMTLDYSEALGRDNQSAP